MAKHWDSFLSHCISMSFCSLLCLHWALNVTISTEFPYLGVVGGFYYTARMPKCLHKVPDWQPCVNLVPMLLQQNPQNIDPRFQPKRWHKVIPRCGQPSAHIKSTLRAPYNFIFLTLLIFFQYFIYCFKYFIL